MAVKRVTLYGARAAGRTALVDEGDYGTVSKHHWTVWEEVRPGGRTAGPYAQTNIWRNGRRTTIRMHVLITGWRQTDHVNHNGLDNRRINLRNVGPPENAANQRPQRGRSSLFKGVSWHRATEKWAANIKVDGRRRHLGLFGIEEDAARAYDAAAYAAFGEYAFPNFPWIEPDGSEAGNRVGT